MIFTKKRLPNPPTLTIKGNNIEWVKTFKYLGLTFDAPTLTWKSHIEETCRQGTQRLNILKALAGTTWGADRALLLQIYIVFIRSKLTYGMAAVSSAADSRIKALNRIQNAALRIALGAKNTSPITALQVEANIPPLDLYIREYCSKYYIKSRSQGETHPMMQDMLEDQAVENKLWTPGVFKKPFTKRTQQWMRWWNVPADLQIEDQPLQTIPQWNRPPLNIQLELTEPVKKGECTERLKAIAQATMEEKYTNHLHIFTDGSKVEKSTSSAIWIPEQNIKKGWKLEEGEHTTIMTAEMFAIKKAMEWTTLNQFFIEKKDIVIFTDSMSSLQALQNFSSSKSPSQKNQIYNIADLIMEKNFTITLQWVPSHTGLAGNEAADEAAKDAHALNTLTFCPLGPEEGKNIIRRAAHKAWQEDYNSKKDELELGIIKPEIKKWPWASHKNREIETAMARLRISHVELNMYLHRFNQSDNPQCPTCNVPEDVAHYILHCSKHTQARQKLFNILRKGGLYNFDLRHLLGGGKGNLQQQQTIADSVGVYLRETGRLHGFNH